MELDALRFCWAHSDRSVQVEARPVFSWWPAAQDFKSAQHLFTEQLPTETISARHSTVARGEEWARMGLPAFASVPNVRRDGPHSKQSRQLRQAAWLTQNKDSTPEIYGNLQLCKKLTEQCLLTHREGVEITSGFSALDKHSGAQPMVPGGLVVCLPRLSPDGTGYRRRTTPATCCQASVWGLRPETEPALAVPFWRLGSRQKPQLLLGCARRSTIPHGFRLPRNCS